MLLKYFKMSKNGNNSFKNCLDKNAVTICNSPYGNRVRVRAGVIGLELGLG
jgi:23S rRNA G2445 N2-methylase RlmL